MRFITNHPGAKVVAIGAQWEPMANGGTRIIRPDFICEFDPWDLDDHERALARKHFTWSGTPRSEDGRELDPIDDLHRVAVYDTGKIADPQQRKDVEKALLEHPALGTEYIQVERPTLAPPYAKYAEHRKVQGRRTLEHAITQITESAKTMIALGEFDIDGAITYEKANGNSPEVVAALESLRPEVAKEEELVSA